MKLKKIASLALAGIMAVSMLAGCKDGGNSNSGSSSEGTNPNAGYSASVLDKTDTAKLYASAEDSAKLNSAVAAVVKNAASGAVVGQYNLTAIAANDTYVTVANAAMTGANYSNDFAAALNKAATDKKDTTVYVLYYITRTLSDDIIDNKIADALDGLCGYLKLPSVASGDSYDYTVSVAKADWLAGNEADVTKDGVVVGLAISFDYTAAQY